MATDYEKKYKEALERAKRLTSDMTTLQKIREFIFPELAESEDERIRKELVNFILYKAGRVLLDKETEHRFVAYLEKQKEQKPLRPSWKPSEEQMKALKEIVNILAESPFLHQNDYLFNILNGLREELKKLL